MVNLSSSAWPHRIGIASAIAAILLVPALALIADESPPTTTMTIPSKGLGRCMGVARENGFLAGIPVEIEHEDDLFLIRTPVDRIAEVTSLLDLSRALADHDFWARPNRFRFGASSPTEVSFRVSEIHPVELAVHLAVSAGMPIAVDPCVLSRESGPTERLDALHGNSFECPEAALDPVSIAVQDEPWDAALERILANSDLALFRYWEIWLLTTPQRAEPIARADSFKIAGGFEPAQRGPDLLQKATMGARSAVP